MKLNVGVFFGGKATEHEVSVITALQAIENIDQEKYKIVPIYISKQEDFYYSEELLNIENYKELDKLLKNSAKIILVKESDKLSVYKYPIGFLSKSLATIDLAFLALHGNKGENGCIQGMMEMYNIPYVGSGVLASAIGMDKDIAKIIAKSIEVPVIDWVAFDKYEYYANTEEVLTRILSKLEFPMIIKPSNGGSSIGIEIAKNCTALKAGIDQVFSYDSKVIVENKITKIREVNCSVIGDISNTRTSVIEEPATDSDILSFEDKYMTKANKGMSSAARIIPAPLEQQMEAEIIAYSNKLFKKFGCAGVVRIDYIIDTERNKVYFNEVNTIPGSLSFYLWKHNDLDYTQELDELIKIAAGGHRRKNEINYSFSNNLFAVNGLNMKGKLKG